MGDEFYLHEDEWGMISLEPRENHDDRRRVVAEARAHGEEHQAAGGGWTRLYVAPEAPVKLDGRALTVAALEQELGPRWIRYARVTTGYSSHREDCPRAFAFRLAASTDPFGNVLYGSASDGRVSSLCVTRADRGLGAVLHRLGLAFRLILCDLWRDEVVDLADRLALERYLADEPDDDDG